jgi:PPOX class probable F420-dependent enzyme
MRSESHGGPVLNDIQKSFLKEHHLAVLATGRSDGSPQVSTVMYDYDGTDIAISIKRYTAKWKNVLRQPRVGLVINDGRKQLIVYGTARAIEADPERMDLTRRLFRRVSGQDPGSAEELKPLLDKQERTAFRIVPETAFMND